MRKITLGLIAGVLLTLNSHALDLRIISGAMLPDNIHLKDSTPLGIEISEYTNTQYNGFSYGLRAGLVSIDGDVSVGSYANLNMEILYRYKRRYEPYIIAGGLYQNLEKEDFGYGYSYGGGLRYVWSNKMQIGAEFFIQKMTFKSGRDETLSYDNTKYKSHNIGTYIGYRF